MESASILETNCTRQATERTPFKVSHLSRVLVTSCLVLLSVVIAAVPSAGELLQFERDAVASGRWWQIFSGHFVHWNQEHLFWDLFVFAILGVICELRDRWRFALTLIATGVSIPITVCALLPELGTYRGLSGLDTALITLLAVGIVQEQWRDRQWGWVAGIGALLAALAAKITFELITGSTLFVDSSPGNFQPVPLAHVVGAFIGLTIGWQRRRR